ncbi:MAG: alpha-galactosidase [Candidatus Brocadiia bacterium]
MAQIALIGAGSHVFAEAMIRDSLTFPALEGSTFRLMDIDEPVLGHMETLARRLIAQGDYPAEVTATTDRREALDGADYVIVSILVGGLEPIYREIDIPMQHGVDQCIGDTMGPGGIFRAMRTIPVMVDIARDMEELCPDALMINYTNPMSMLCQAVRQRSEVEVIGLCHSVQGAHAELARIIEAEPDQCASWVAGINHQAWVLKYEHNGQDAYPRIRRAARENEGWYEHNTTRVEMLRRLGYYVTESSGHNSEYSPWFRKRPDLVEKYQGEDWNGGHGFIKDIYGDRYEDRAEKLRRHAEETEELRLERGHEYGSYIMNALESGETFRFNATVGNDRLITNLPPDCSVEVPCYADRSGVHPCHVGELPPQLAALNSMAVRSTSMAVEACLRGDKDMLYWSVLYDPLTAAALSMKEIRDMVDELYAAEKDEMPTFGD